MEAGVSRLLTFRLGTRWGCCMTLALRYFQHFGGLAWDVADPDLRSWTFEYPCCPSAAFLKRDSERIWTNLTFQCILSAAGDRRDHSIAHIAGLQPSARLFWAEGQLCRWWWGGKKGEGVQQQKGLLEWHTCSRGRGWSWGLTDCSDCLGRTWKFCVVVKKELLL